MLSTFIITALAASRSEERRQKAAMRRSRPVRRVGGAR